MPEEARVAAIVTLTKMSTNEEDYTVLWSSANLVEVLTELSKDKDEKVRCNVAVNSCYAKFKFPKRIINF